MYPFERFTEDAKRALTLAQEEAERSHHSYIGTEHLLLALLRVQDGVACRVLTDLGVDIGTVREVIKSVLGRNERIIVQQIIPTSRVKRVIELSFEEAMRLGHSEVDTGDVLLGLIIEGEGIAAHVLQDLGATLGKVRTAMERYLTTPAAERSSISRPPTPLGGLRRVALREGDVYASEAARLASLLKSPGIAGLLKARGVDVDALSKQLAEPPLEVLEIRGRLAVAGHAMERAVSSQDFEVAAPLRDEIIDLQIKLGQAEQEWLDSLA
jgi:ATP-dependent Clp protease ATP-binding subunit ClpC